MKKSVAAVLTAGVMAIGVISSGLTVFATGRANGAVGRMRYETGCDSVY